MSTIIVKLSQAVIIVSTSCSDLKICEFFHAVYLCASSILTVNSEYLKDRNNREVFVMGTENKTFSASSVSRSNKRHFLCAVDTALLLLGLGLQFHWNDAGGRQHRGCIIPQTVTHSLVLLKMGKIISRNMLS